MDTFTSTVGYSPSFFAGAMEWLLTATIVIFAVLALYGAYQRWNDNDLNFGDLLFDGVAIMAIVTWVGFLIK